MYVRLRVHERVDGEKGDGLMETVFEKYTKSPEKLADLILRIMWNSAESLTPYFTKAEIVRFLNQKVPGHRLEGQK